MTQLDTFDRVLLSMHDAMLDDALWPSTSRLIDEACGVRGNALVVGRGRSQKDADILFSRFCYRGERHPDRERWYFDLYFPLDERVPRVAQLPDGKLVPIPALYTERELKTSPAYNEAMPRGRYQNGLNVRLDGPQGSSIVWTFADPTRSGGWQTAQLGMVERLLPHIPQFVRVRQAMSGAEALGHSLNDLLDNTRIGVLHLQRGGRIIEANDRAHSLLRQGDGLFDDAGFLAARLPADDARLRRTLEKALPGFGGRGPSGGSFTVGRPSPLPRLAVHISPVGNRQMAMGLGRVAALVLVVEPDSRPRVDPRLMAEAFGLTPAESEVAALMAEGRTVAAVAAATGRQQSSVRSLVRRLYRKQGISRQADLVRLVLSLAELPILRD